MRPRLIWGGCRVIGVSLGLLLSTVVNMSLLVMLCIGFTFTYMMEKFPNFAHTSLATLGTMVTFYLVRLRGLNPYLTWPLSALVGGLAGILLYQAVVKPLRGRPFSDITLTFTFYIVGQIISKALAVFSYWLLVVKKMQSQGFNLYAYDTRLWGLPAISVAAPLTVLTIVLLLQGFLKWSKHGVAMRATAENEALAQGLGVDVGLMHIASWWISGSLAALSGSIVSMWLNTSVNYSDALIVNVMAGSVLGGLNSITGAILGGFLVAVGTKALTWALISHLGVAMGAYEALIPIVFLFTILAIEPNGLTAIDRTKLSKAHLRESLRRLARTLRNVATTE